MSKFKNGDRVRTVRQNMPLYDLGEIGKVLRHRKVDDMYLVHFDDKDGILRESWLCDGSIELLKAKHPVIVITTDGVTTTATKRLGKKVLGTAYSKCAPADTFDYDTGVGLALARLCGFKIQIHEEEKTPMPKKVEHFKVVCTQNETPASNLFKVGKVYDAMCEEGGDPIVTGPFDAPYYGRWNLFIDNTLSVAFSDFQRVFFVRLVED